MMGNLIGIVNAKTSETGIEGLGFAIPSNIVLNFFNRVMVTEPAIGIEVAYGKRNNIIGVYVVETVNSNFKKYDRIYSVNGQDVINSADYYAIIDSCKSGDEITISVVRDKKIIDIKVKIP